MSVGEVGGTKIEDKAFECGEDELASGSERGMGGEEAARALNIPLASFLPSCGSNVSPGGALLRAKNRVKEGDEFIVEFGLERVDVLELAFVIVLVFERDQKEEKKVEEGVDELAVANDSVGDSVIVDTLGADRLLAEVTCCNIPWEDATESSLRCEVFLVMSLDIWAGVDVSRTSPISPAEFSANCSFALPKLLLHVT